MAKTKTRVKKAGAPKKNTTTGKKQKGVKKTAKGTGASRAKKEAKIAAKGAKASRSVKEVKKAAKGARASRTEGRKVTPPIEKVFLPDDWNNTEKLILARRSTRAYQNRQVPKQMIRRILECGRYAPSEGNYQPWRFIVVRDQTMLKEMEDDAKKAITKIWKVINYRDHPWKKPHTKLLEFLTPNNLHPIPSGAIQGVAEGKFHIFWGAPTVILLLKDKRGIGNPDLDIGITGTNMVLAAHSMGLGTCWIGVATTLMFYKKWRETFNIRHPWYLEQGLLVGFPVGDPDGFVHRETHCIDWFDEDGRHQVVK